MSACFIPAAVAAPLVRLSQTANSLYAERSTSAALAVDPSDVRAAIVSNVIFILVMLFFRFIALCASR